MRNLAIVLETGRVVEAAFVASFMIGLMCTGIRRGNV